jgi:hypothetical protein
MQQMKWAVQALFIMVLAGTLATSALACPLLMGPMSQGDMPGSHQGDNPDQCQSSICQASSPYLDSHAGFHAPLLQELPAELLVSTLLWASLGIADLIKRDDGGPPGLSDPLFLRTHSLLI